MARKPQNLILVTEHYPCSNQESFLETEIPYLARFFNVHVVTRAVDERMSRILPNGVTFSRPVTHGGKLYRGWIRFVCRMSRSYRLERRAAQEEGRWNRVSAAHALDALVESELLRRYILTLPVLQDERPLVIYSANFNDYLYGLCRIKEMGKDIHVAARICRIDGISGHADREGLLRWISAFTEKPKKVFVVHGEDLTSDLFASTLRNRLSLDAEAPYSGSVFDLAKGAWVTRAAPRRVEKLENKTSRAGAVFARLIAAGQRLMAVIKQNEGLANKELAKFADQINALCDKWQR